jgi:threonine aldolase
VASEQERVDEIRDRCDRFLVFHPRRTTGAILSDLAEYAGDRMADIYAEGELIESLEGRVAGLLGTEAAAFFPSGTMAQQAALRVWSEKTGVDTVALHPLSHIDHDELRAVWELHHLRPLMLNHERRQPSVADLAAVPERVGTLVVELPLSLAGHVLPTWEELTALCAAAREREAIVHFDGARLWESTSRLGQGLADIARLADSVYVSFYKSLGAISGAALAGPSEFIDATRRWRRRHGGTLFTQFPALISAHRALDITLPRIPLYVEHARDIAVALTAVDRVRVHPDPPDTNAFRIYVEADNEALTEAVLAHADQHKVWTWAKFWPAEVPGWSFVELTVAESTMGWQPDELASVIVELLAHATP